MSRPAKRVDRLVLLAYPRSFRHDYGDEITRTLDDLRVHHDVRGWRLGLRIGRDVVATAPRLRLESLMSRNRVLVVVGVLTAVVVAGFAGTPIFLLAAAAVVAWIVVGARRHDRPITGDDPRLGRWSSWAVGGVISIGIGAAVAASAGGDELSEPIWAIWALTWFTGIVLLGVAFVLGVARLAQRRAI